MYTHILTLLYSYIYINIYLYTGFTKGFQQSLANYKKGVIANKITTSPNKPPRRASYKARALIQTQNTLESVNSKVSTYLSTPESPVRNTRTGTNNIHNSHSPSSPPPRIIAPRAVPVGMLKKTYSNYTNNTHDSSIHESTGNGGGGGLEVIDEDLRVSTLQLTSDNFNQDKDYVRPPGVYSVYSVCYIILWSLYGV